MSQDETAGHSTPALQGCGAGERREGDQDLYAAGRAGWYIAVAITWLAGVSAATSFGSGSRDWSALYGGSGSEEMEGIRRTSDGGMIVVGSSDSFRDPNGEAWVIKLDASGIPQWQKTYGGTGDEYLTDVRQTSDGGYISAGWTKSFGVTRMDGWVLKLSSTGSVEWAKTYGGSKDEQFWSVDLTNDGGYVVAGGTTSFGAGKADYWVLKLDASGNVRWQKTFGGPKADGGAGSFPEFVVRALVDAGGNIVVVSESRSFAPGFAAIWALKLDANGDVIWEKAYGGFDEDTMWTFDATSDGGYIVPGSTVSFSPDFSGDTWVLKLDANGDILWQKVFALSSNWDEALSVGATSDGGAVIGSYVEEGASDWDFLLFRLDASGTVLWQRSYEYGWDWPNSVQQMADGGFAVAGVAWPKPGEFDLWVQRLDSDGLVGNSCSSIRSLDLQVSTSTVSPVDTNATVQNTNVSPQSVSVTVQDTTGSPNFLCRANPAEDCSNGVDDDGDGAADCADTQCVELPVCTLPTDYGKPRAVTRFQLGTTQRDRSVSRMCVTQEFCDALATVAGDASKKVTITPDGCPSVTIGGEAIRSNSAATHYWAKLPRGQVPGGVLDIACNELNATVKLRRADLQACVTNPVGLTLFASGTRSLRAEATFDEVIDNDGKLRRLVFKTDLTCPLTPMRN